MAIRCVTFSFIVHDRLLVGDLSVWAGGLVRLSSSNPFPRRHSEQAVSSQEMVRVWRAVCHGDAGCRDWVTHPSSIVLVRARQNEV